MSYIRVLPRDLFNESSLLKCYGRLWILLDDLRQSSAFPEDADCFEIVQAPDDGSLYVANLPLAIGGREYRLSRPLNSREPWPLYADEIGNLESEPVPVFDGEGNLTPEMKALLSL